MKYTKPIVLVVSGFFILVSWSSIWFEISAVGVYSEGIDREPTITTDYIIDNNYDDGVNDNDNDDDNINNNDYDDDNDNENNGNDNSNNNSNNAQCSFL